MDIIDTISDKKVFDVIDGPSRETIFDALKYAYDEMLNALYAEFRVRASDSTKIRMHSVKINSLAHESGTGHNFLLSGYGRLDNIGTHGRQEYRIKFDMYYNANTRKGHVKFEVC